MTYRVTWLHHFTGGTDDGSREFESRAAAELFAEGLRAGLVVGAIEVRPRKAIEVTMVPIPKHIKRAMAAAIRKGPRKQVRVKS